MNNWIMRSAQTAQLIIRGRIRVHMILNGIFIQAAPSCVTVERSRHLLPFRFIPSIPFHSTSGDLPLFIHGLLILPFHPSIPIHEYH